MSINGENLSMTIGGDPTISSMAPPDLVHFRESLARNGKSFNWAAKLFKREDADRIARLYAFCRYADDIADNLDEVNARLGLEKMVSDLRGGHSQEPIVSNLLELLDGQETALASARYLVESLLADTGKVRIQTQKELIRYAYGVAGTVGIMVCELVGARDPSALPFAIDLGIGMQLTNIARDVIEDARRDRIYLPADAFHQTVSPERILSEDPRMHRELSRLIVSVLKRADDYYCSAYAGMRYLPRRPRMVILTAAYIYQAIGPRILQSNQRLRPTRAYVSTWGKLYHTLRAISSLISNPEFWHIGRAPKHDPALHAALQGLPGTRNEDL
jgi:phytoene synthase